MCQIVVFILMINVVCSRVDTFYLLSFFVASYIVAFVNIFISAWIETTLHHTKHIFHIHYIIT